MTDYRPTRDWARWAEDQVRKQRDQKPKGPPVKQTSPRLWVPVGARLPVDGTNRFLQAKRKARITLAKIQIQDDEP